MPLYEYQCKKCKHRFEKIQKFSDPALRKCPECGGPVEKLLSAPSVQFKGSGWYVTDYARKGSGGASADSGAASSGDGAGAKGTGEKTEKTEKADSKKADKSDKKHTKK